MGRERRGILSQGILSFTHTHLMRARFKKKYKTKRERRFFPLCEHSFIRFQLRDAARASRRVSSVCPADPPCLALRGEARLLRLKLDQRLAVGAMQIESQFETNGLEGMYFQGVQTLKPRALSTRGVSLQHLRPHLAHYPQLVRRCFGPPQKSVDKRQRVTTTMLRFR